MLITTCIIPGLLSQELRIRSGSFPHAVLNSPYMYIDLFLLWLLLRVRGCENMYIADRWIELVGMKGFRV